MKKYEKNLIKHTYENSEFYRHKWHGLNIDNINDICELPVVAKNDMIGYENRFFCHDFIVPQCMGKVCTERTSGSTGKCLEISWGRSDYEKSLLPLYIFRKKYYGITPGDKLCYFFTYIPEKQLNGKFYEYRKSGLGFSKSALTDERFCDIVNMINDFKPVWLILQPSAGFILAKYIYETGAEVPDSIRYIEFTGEFLSARTRLFITNAFNCSRSADQYGAYEVNSIAYECPAGHLHIMNNLIVEITDDDGKRVKDGKEGNITVTSLQNKAMPFIRYKIGDIGSKYKTDCPFSKAECIHLVNARSNDIIITDTGESISVYAFSRLFLIMEQLGHSVYQYRIVQKDFDKFEVYIVTDDDEELIKSIFLKSISIEYLKKSKYEFKFRRSLLPDNFTGKLKWFISEVKA